MNNINRIDKRLALLNDGFTEIPGYPGYWAREDGVIASLRNKEAGHYKILKPTITKKGYYWGNLRKEGNRICIFWHRLVAITFIPNPENKPQVNHIDGIKLNNCVDNLEWVTSSENMVHARSAGLLLSPSGAKNNWAKLNDETVIEIHRAYRNGAPTKELAMRYGVKIGAIRSIAAGINWKHLNLTPILRIKSNGENHCHTKLKESDVLEIRSMSAKGIMGKDIAIKFGCSKNIVYDILNRNTWKHI